MDFPQNPIAFVDLLVARHKSWLKARPRRGESIRYMREAVDQQGAGSEFMTYYVYNPEPAQPNPAAEDTDLALLQLYAHWRQEHGLRPIEPWDGSRLRPWLPEESNPTVPALLQGDLSHFNDAYVRWGGNNEWPAIDALGNAIEQYFRDIRRHSIWSRPTGGGKLRLYRHNELNNIETAPYSIRFWGFLQWADDRRRTLAGERVQSYPHDKWSDITFMDQFNEAHFPWHDDVFGNGHCPKWHSQFGEKARHKYPMNTYGFGLEFLEFHSDLLDAYNDFLMRWNRPPTTSWRDGDQPWEPGIHHSAHILKQAGFGPWGIGGTNGEALAPEIFAPALLDPELSKFNTGSELGAYLEGFGARYHGAGHLEHCDIRDPYTNNYSLRFFHWHQWIDGLYKRLLAQGKPKISDVSDEQYGDKVKDAFFGRFEAQPELKFPLTGTWTYRSYNNEANRDEDNLAALWFVADLTLEQSGNGQIAGKLQGGHPDPNSDYVYDVEGFYDDRNVAYELTPDWWEQREIIVLTAKGATSATDGHVYEYRGHLVANWPNGKDRVPAFVGSVVRTKRPDDPTKEGKVGSFIAILQPKVGPLIA